MPPAVVGIAVDEAVLNALPPQDIANALQAQQFADDTASFASLNLNDDAVRQPCHDRCPSGLLHPTC